MPNGVDKNDVVISVNGGCVEVESVPDNLRVIVKDYDCLDFNNDDPLARKALVQRDSFGEVLIQRNAFGDRYIQTVHEGGETPQMTERQKEIIRIALRILVVDLANFRTETKNIEMSLTGKIDGSFDALEEKELHEIIDLLN